LGCGSAYLDPRPTEAAIGRAYERYFDSERPAARGGRDGVVDRLRMKIVNGHLNAALDYKLGPASRLGAALVPLLPKRRWRAEWTVRHLRKPPGAPRVLDVGCGTGEFLVAMRDAGWEVAGIEPHPPSAWIARETGLEVQQSSFHEADLPERAFDAVTLNHVIEHLHDPAAALSRCRELLQPGGTLWVATPNADALGHRRFGPAWFGLDPPRHLVVLTPRALEGLLREAGFVGLRQVRAYRADLTFPASDALDHGGDAFAPAKPRTGLRNRARLADLRTFLRPDRAEELTMVATAPGAGG
jgi:SAM-dependent methyltransferase